MSGFMLKRNGLAKSCNCDDFHGPMQAIVLGAQSAPKGMPRLSRKKELVPFRTSSYFDGICNQETPAGLRLPLSMRCQNSKVMVPVSWRLFVLNRRSSPFFAYAKAGVPSFA